MGLILSFFGGTVGRYLLIAGGLLAVLAWFLHDAVAPYRAQIATYKAEIVSLRLAAQQSAASAAADAAQAELDRADAAKTKEQLRELTDAANANPTACKFDPATMSRLRHLAGYSGDANADETPLPAPGLRLAE